MLQGFLWLTILNTVSFNPRELQTEHLFTLPVKYSYLICIKILVVMLKFQFLYSELCNLLYALYLYTNHVRSNLWIS